MSPAPVVQAFSLRKRYRARDPLAVDGVSFSIGTGQALGLLGPNGAGKSTIVKMIAGLTWPDGGHVQLFGSSPGDVKARALLGFVPEDPDFPRFLRAGEVLAYFGRLLGCRRRIGRAGSPRRSSGPGWRGRHGRCATSRRG